MALPPLVLLVEDHGDHREMYAEVLAFAGLRVAEAGSGEQALSMASELIPAAIVMDLGLPRMDGREITTRLRTDPRTRGIPVIALSGHGSDEDRRRAEEAGCDAYLTKPCRPDELVQQVRAVLRPVR